MSIEYHAGGTGRSGRVELGLTPGELQARTAAFRENVMSLLG